MSVRARQSVMALAVLLAAAQVAGTAAVIQSGDLRAREERREREQRVADVFKALGVRPGSVVADVGAGQGFFTVRLAEAVGESGRVLAVDISASVVRSLRARVEREGLSNIEVIEGAAADPRLPAGSLDAALIVNAYHEMTEHKAMLTHIRKALKPGGRLVIIEPISASRRDATREAQARRHEIAPEFVQQDARAAGFAIAALEDPFSNHHGHGGEYLIVLTPSDAPPAAAAEEHSHDDEVKAEKAADAARISAAEFLPLYKQGKLIVLDVRDQQSYDQGHIPQAKLAPMHTLREFVPQLKEADLAVVTYCSCPAEETSGRAAAYLHKRGVKDVRALIGGYEAWEAAGNPVERR